MVTQKLTKAQKVTNFESLGKVTKEFDGKIISEESDSQIQVTLSTYKRVFSYSGGWRMLLLINLILLSQFLTDSMLTYKIGLWATDQKVQIENSARFAIQLVGVVCF